jgi:hypothetical protein
MLSRDRQEEGTKGIEVELILGLHLGLKIDDLTTPFFRLFTAFKLLDI